MATDFLRWVKGMGWLVFSGGEGVGSPIRATALAKAKAAGGVAYISLADDAGDALMDDMEDLGAPYGYIVDLEMDDGPTIIEQLSAASVIVVEVGQSLDALYNLINESVQQGMLEAYRRGGIILFEGLAANVAGRWTISDTGELMDGLDWVKNCFIEPDTTSVEESHTVRRILEAFPEAIAINLASGSAIAMGANGSIELWGDRHVTIGLGRYYTDK